MKNKLNDPLIKRILLRYVSTVLLAIGIYGGVLLLLLFLFRLRTWYGDEPFYLFLRTLYIRFNLIGLVSSGAFLLLLMITLVYIFKLIGYLNETITATKQLLEAPEQRIQLSTELFTVQEEMNQIRENNNQANRAAKVAEQRKNDLIVYLAHDLRTSLTSVIGYLTLLKEEPQISTELRAKYTDIALDKALRLEELIGEFFEVTQFNLTKLTINKEIVDLSIMLEQISYEFLPILNEKGLKWQLAIDKGIKAEVDPNKMGRVFDNLIRNAINYSFSNSTIHLSLEKNGQNLELKITNETHTLPEEKLTQIFEPFYRVDTSRSSSTGGTGLGLSIVKDIVEASGGRIHAQSSNNQMTFTLTLPISE
ncbi:vancomycin resistance histidine kinase VanS-N [Enterococcus faecium]|uniref:histidine kinase n=1 Tax=Enterococcus faecium TaxID=1352 RepID=G4XFL2_ENTFC|nr:vancomycin resistance histidine kinase VanS-N [Enterococcus faecium]AEP40504.1 VanSN [Enterococcus faecium]